MHDKPPAAAKSDATQAGSAPSEQGAQSAESAPSVEAPQPSARELQVQALEYWGQVSFLKGGINDADVVTTVSPITSIAADVIGDLALLGGRHGLPGELRHGGAVGLADQSGA